MAQTHIPPTDHAVYTKVRLLPLPVTLGFWRKIGPLLTTIGNKVTANIGASTWLLVLGYGQAGAPALAMAIILGATSVGALANILGGVPCMPVKMWPLLRLTLYSLTCNCTNSAVPTTVEIKVT